jgi:hypothetical protein
MVDESNKSSLSSAFYSPIFRHKKARMDSSPGRGQQEQRQQLQQQTSSPSRSYSFNSPVRTVSQSARLRQAGFKKTYFNDPVHGNIAMDGLCLRIIDTKEFQRLRELKQLGTCDFVFHGATHSRFSHSIGVAHIAEQVVRTLMRNQPYLGITEEDVLCVKVRMQIVCFVY